MGKPAGNQAVNTYTRSTNDTINQLNSLQTIIQPVCKPVGRVRTHMTEDYDREGSSLSKPVSH